MITSKELQKYENILKNKKKSAKLLEDWNERDKIIKQLGKEIIKDFKTLPIKEMFKSHQGVKVKPKAIKLIRQKLKDLKDFLGTKEEWEVILKQHYHWNIDNAYWDLKNDLQSHYKEAFMNTIKPVKGMTVGGVLEKTGGRKDAQGWYRILEGGDQLIKRSHHLKPLAYAINDWQKRAIIIIKTDRQVVAYNADFEQWRANIYEISILDAYNKIKEIYTHKFDCKPNLKVIKKLAVVEAI